MAYKEWDVFFRLGAVAAVAALGVTLVQAYSYTNFETSQVHPIALSAAGDKLFVVNTPTAALEVFNVAADGSLTRAQVIPVGLEPVTVRPRTATEVWVVNNLSDSISIVDLTRGIVTKTLRPGDEPTDVVFAGGRAFVSVSKEDTIEVYNLSNLSAAPTPVALFGSVPRALAVSTDGTKVWAVVQNSGNRTTVIGRLLMDSDTPMVDYTLESSLGLNPYKCSSTPPNYPPNPPGINTNPSLPPMDARPSLGLVVKWNPATNHYEDDAGQNWTMCLPFRLPDKDLFSIDTTTLAVASVSGVGTTLFDVSVNPGNGKVYVPNTDARNNVRFDHELGVKAHVVDNHLSIVNPASGNSLTILDLNSHIDTSSRPPDNLAERQASISQATMIAWEPNGLRGWMTALGSHKIFRVDGSCTASSCIVGASRSTPDSVEVGGGPTGIAVSTAKNRVYVLLRFSNSIALVDQTARVKLGEVPLFYDPSDSDTKQGRQFLYEAQNLSRHGDQACSSCHISGHSDFLSWDLGNPEDSLVPYGQPNDNVRFFTPGGSDCPTSVCAAHPGFDPRKGPMVTQTLRAMIEPLHWRADRPTFLDFNPAFVDLLGSTDVGPVNGKEAGLSATDMATYRRFMLAVRFPPNPHRNLDDTVPNAVVSIPGQPVAGNPSAGEFNFFNVLTEQTVGCKDCHMVPFGTAGGQLGGVEPSDPPDARAGMINGDLVLSFMTDVKVPHLRWAYERFGPVYGTAANPPDRKTGFGYDHEGGVPDLDTFFTALVFHMNAQQLKDTAMYVNYFPTGTKPAVGHQVTVPAGAPPTGSPQDESDLTTMLAVGDSADPNRHCELVAQALQAGRMRSYEYGGGVWIPDSVADPTLTTTALRTNAGSELTFTCATLGAGTRLGLDWDEDGVYNADDCAPVDPNVAGPPTEIMALGSDPASPKNFTWTTTAIPFPSVQYDVFGSTLSSLQAGGLNGIQCVASNLPTPNFADPRPDPDPGDGYYYFVRGKNSCGSGPIGPAVTLPSCP
jgi:DNA-binding beta-propeller fold protein YncE